MRPPAFGSASGEGVEVVLVGGDEGAHEVDLHLAGLVPVALVFVDRFLEEDGVELEAGHGEEALGEVDAIRLRGVDAEGRTDVLCNPNILAAQTGDEAGEEGD